MIPSSPSRSPSALVKKALHSPGRAARKARIYAQHWVQDWQRRLTQADRYRQQINQTEIRVVGLRRTGNHALITWIQAQAGEQVQHLNNLIPDENPYRYKYEQLRDYYPEHQVMMERYRQQAIGNFTDKDCLIYSYEDHDLAAIASPKFEQRHDLYLGHSHQRYDVLILRDPFNLFASRFKQGYLEVSAPGKTMVDLWLDYAKEFLHETQRLNQCKVCVNYNQWASDRNYRAAIAAQLGLEFTDAGINDVGTWGGGSSFEGQSFQGRAREMDVTNRWQHFSETPAYRSLFKHTDLWHYSERIFGHIPGTDSLR